jgi:hypothetical protein
VKLDAGRRSQAAWTALCGPAFGFQRLAVITQVPQSKPVRGCRVVTTSGRGRESATIRRGRLSVVATGRTWRAIRRRRLSGMRQTRGPCRRATLRGASIPQGRDGVDEAQPSAGPSAWGLPQGRAGLAAPRYVALGQHRRRGSRWRQTPAPRRWKRAMKPERRRTRVAPEGDCCRD